MRYQNFKWTSEEYKDGQSIIEGDILLVEDEEEFGNSVFVVFEHQGEWVVHPLFDVHLQAYEGSNGIYFAEQTSGFLDLESFVEYNDFVNYGNIFDVQEFANYLDNKEGR